ncbi:nitrilase 1-like protein [Dinothrombium tinctorium]|uniref:Nitrilase and fragile histidine triad fusion protein NitFhit n=1 Tax=Dinothrombium tinctorium TaxID=1965070 RepID=A0A3S4RL54_9ACAR|nr:nitrilase 1-like protein [Dinothrombium tinctorium]RWS17511.1 nitrilase 1-like protein [Dinothrombium tinctorium]RWS17531.1 nitrilase 1-like protein [Dinothrombium tinctorium]
MEGKHLIAVCQMNAKENKNDNFEVCKSMIERAAAIGCEMVFLPECFDMICDSKKKTLENIEPIVGPLITNYRQLAQKCNVWLSLGGLHEKGPKYAETGKASNAHIVINANGDIASVYRKVHLFNLDIPGVVRLVESEFSVAGDAVIDPVSTPIGKVGLGICYDVRFPEFATALAKAGADILTYPSSFTVPTGLAHWETLLRARAIENQCYVVAAAQFGTHNTKRSSYGHAMVVDPWGTVIAQCSEKSDFAVAVVDGDFLKTARMKLPIWTDRRSELYGNIIPPIAAEVSENQTYHFGAVEIHPYQVFYKTRFTFAFVNHRPLLPGHVLVAPLRVSAERMCDLTSNEITDVFTTVQKVQKAIETEYEARSSTVAIQDGPEAGQSIRHLHVHILPRKSEDFGGNIDKIYSELQKHDKIGNEKTFKLLNEEEMSANADRLRKYFV